MVAPRDLEPVRRALRATGFPVDRDTVVAEAEREGAIREVLTALRAMPAADYNEADEVLRSVPVDDPADPHRDTGGS
ncbi:DUF2795 domain-containing protein [Nocardiopsis trehalosi]|jgi:hypothetical protein|uniref:DUF2795 domain-containing protein n=1 Tax=Nocardiopsis trehalosi TaxID=109329 RepID=UPI00082FBE40|nr:DUF2795 domain-containing protein [Nocardiopsis trehalosi]